MPTEYDKPALTGDDYRTLKELGEAHKAVRAELSRRIIGQAEVVEQVLTAFFAGGHVLLLGVPGLGKTLLIRSLAEILGLKFNRIQFTPDLMPSDITGSDVLASEGGERTFKFLGGPIFTNFVLADEINRTPPKTQAAMLEAMEENSVTVAGHSYPLPRPFFVMATQNPIEQEGTYLLPAAALDRFLFTVIVDYPTQIDEMNMLFQTTSKFELSVKRILDEEKVVRMLDVVRRINISDETMQYAIDLVRATRPHESHDEQIKDMVECGGSPRATQALILGAKSRAALEGRDEATPRDIRAVAMPALHHRILTNFHADADNVTSRDLVHGLIKTVPRPVGDNEPEQRPPSISLGQWFLELILGSPRVRTKAGAKAAAFAGGFGIETQDDAASHRKLGATRVAATMMDIVFSMLLPGLAMIGLWAAFASKLGQVNAGPKLLGILVAMSLAPFVLATVGQTVLTATRGATAGALLFGLKVVDAEGGRLGFGAALWRSTIVWISSLFFWAFPILEMFGLLIASERGIPDLVCGTTMVRGTD